MQPGGAASGAGSVPVRVFRCSVGRRPDIVACEIDVLPAERGQVGENFVGDLLDRAQGGGRAARISGVPQDDRRDEKVQAGGAMLLRA